MSKTPKRGCEKSGTFPLNDLMAQYILAFFLFCFFIFKIETRAVKNCGSAARHISTGNKIRLFTAQPDTLHTMTAITSHSFRPAIVPTTPPSLRQNPSPKNMLCELGKIRAIVFFLWNIYIYIYICMFCLSIIQLHIDTM